MAHEFALRAAVAFAILLVAETAWTGLMALAPPSTPPAADHAQTQNPDEIEEELIAAADPVATGSAAATEAAATDASAPDPPSDNAPSSADAPPCL